MLKAGVFLQNRYEIISHIGSGGMADVYKAKDHRLNRFVAVKVLKQEFKDDKVFLSKFRIEAQAAAGLSHTNIVNVYDVGEDFGISYIVMELVDGITLKAYISKKGKLSVREATSIALQVASGLEAAHNNGIIHRDVKPQNIIISLDGKAKIADFGIARAITSNTINSGAVGSVHYSAPEQSRGGYSDAKSDIYSLGITMFEMLTGRVPFDGDSTVEVALKHLQEEIPSPKKFSPEIPFSTEQIVLKCTQKSASRRYNNMSELIRDLKESLVNPNGNFVTIPVVDSRANTILLTREEINQIKNGSMPSYDPALNTGAADVFSGGGGTVSDSRSYHSGGNYYQNSSYQEVRFKKDTYARGNSSRPTGDRNQNYTNRELSSREEGQEHYEEYPDELPKKKNGKKRGRTDDYGMEGDPKTERILLVISVAAAVIIGLLLLGLMGRSIGLFGGNSGRNEPGSGSGRITLTTDEDTSKLIEVPSLLGRSEAEAQRLLKNQKLTYKYLGEDSSSEYGKGLVVSQSIDAGSKVQPNTTVGYTLSTGASDDLLVPPLVNVAGSQAEQALTDMGLQVTVDNSRYSDTIAEGNVITTNPGAGSSVSAGDRITLYVSQGKDSSLVKVPKVTDKNVEEARKLLTDLGLVVYLKEITNTTVESGLIISQDISDGEKVETGTAITLTVSKGAEAEVVNDGRTWE